MGEPKSRTSILKLCIATTRDLIQQDFDTTDRRPTMSRGILRHTIQLLVYIQ
jgi:hypothetical protein